MLDVARDNPHRTAIEVHCVGCDDMEMAARVELAMIRDAASAAIPRAGDSAGVVLGEVLRLPTHAVYAPARTSELIRIKAALSFAVEAARVLERVTRNAR